MKYFIIAGEASGDLHGGNLIKAIQQRDSDAQFTCWGGDAMKEASGALRTHYKDTSVMGFVEVLLKLRSIKANLDRCKKEILDFQPDVVILIDYPGFNLRIAAFCKAHQIPVSYYIAPKIWAWNEKRGKQLERFVDKLLLIFPFEISYFKKWNVRSEFVGNPLLDAIANFRPNQAFKEKYNLDNRPIIALMPGSRKQEIDRILPKMIESTASYTSYQLVIAGAPGMDQSAYEPYLNNRVSIVWNETYDLLHVSTAAVVCSGTATLETALMNVPQVCGYVANPISYAIGKRLVKVPYISLVNLNLNRSCITELIQHEFNTQRLKQELDLILPGGAQRDRMLKEYEELKQLMGGVGASMRAADATLSLIADRSQ